MSREGGPAISSVTRNSSHDPPSRDAALARLAATQHGVVAFGQLLRLGFPRATVANRLAKGQLHRVRHGVYAVGHDDVSPAGVRLAAALSIGPDAVLSHNSAAAEWGLLRDRGELHVTVARSVRSRPDLVVHSVRTLDRRDWKRRGRTPLTTVPRTVLDLAEHADEPVLRRALRQAEVLGVLREHELRHQLARAPGRRGAARLAELIADGPAPTRSELEDRLLALVRTHRLGDPRVNARLGVPGRTFEVDLLYPHERLIVEADGARYHSGRVARRSDAERQARLEAAGYRVVRVTWDEVTRRPEETVARLRVALRDQRAVARAQAVTARGRPAGAAGGGSSLVTNEGGAIAR